MKLFLVFLMVTISTSFCFSQPLCYEKNLQSLKPVRSFNNTSASLNCSFVDNEEAFRKIEELMRLAGLPMNFTVCKEDNINNAYATMDTTGTRFIVYDNVFLKRLDSDASRLETITVLAHEIGHHLSAHTLFINDENYKSSYKKYCLKESPEYNQKTCEEEYLKFLRLSRDQELEADRFGGYSMQKYGAELKQVMSMYYKITNNNDDKTSTHPKQSKRLDAIKAGYQLAESKSTKGAEKIDLQEIKGGKIDFVIKDLSRIERNKLIWKIKMATSFEAIEALSKQSGYNLGNGSSQQFKQETANKIIEYHGQINKYWLIDNGSEYFEAFDQLAFLADDRRIEYKAAIGIDIKAGMLKILMFNTTGKTKVVYASPFTEAKISLEEIKTIFIEIFKDGLQREMDKYN